jgi:tetraacyldisaccharide 4'-kinase
MSILLYPLTFVYRFLVWLDRRIKKPVKLSKPVISVGNITWGGTGKTPVVIALARLCIGQGLKPAVLTRGYNRKNAKDENIVVSDGSAILCEVDEAGDEPYSIAKSVPGAVVVVGKDRVKSAAAAQKYDPGIFILDDGFQHWKVERNLDIVCVNALDPFGNGMLIPSGKLREPVSSIKRAGAVVITSCDVAPKESLDLVEKKVRKYFKGEPFFAALKPVRLRSIIENISYDVPDFPFKKINALSAVANNNGFVKTLGKCGFEVVNSFGYDDHHWFSENEINRVIYETGEDSCVVSTTKDEEKLRAVLQETGLDAAKIFYVLETDIEYVRGGESWAETVKKALQFS